MYSEAIRSSLACSLTSSTPSPLLAARTFSVRAFLFDIPLLGSVLPLPVGGHKRCVSELDSVTPGHMHDQQRVGSRSRADAGQDCVASGVATRQGSSRSN